MDELGLALIEKPTRQDDDAGHARIARDARATIMLGKNRFGMHEMARTAAASATDMVIPDPMR